MVLTRDISRRSDHTLRFGLSQCRSDSLVVRIGIIGWVVWWEQVNGFEIVSVSYSVVRNDILEMQDDVRPAAAAQTDHATMKN